MVSDLQEHLTLVNALLRPEAWPHATDNIRHIETHISSVLLVGPYAYKIKKPVDFGFLDFSTLELRRVSCEEEIRLNQRLAPDIYLEALPITGTLEAPRVGGDGEPIEWAVKMRRFDEGLLLSAHSSLLDRDLVEHLGRTIARFHEMAAVSPADGVFGSPEAVLAPMRQNFEQVRLLEHDDETLRKLDRLQEWTEQRATELRPLLEIRRAGGFIREGHGDLHLGNIAMAGPHPIIFDGIEFSTCLRWIDTTNDLAFLAMDLESKSRPDLAAWLVNAYLEASGDYAGVSLLRFYEVYRAMVRAKVAALRLNQQSLSPDDIKPLVAEFERYVDLAVKLAQPMNAALLIAHGVSGAGKTVSTGNLIGPLHALRLRSDVERKRLAGLDAGKRTASGQDQGIYTKDATQSTYERLVALARQALDAGFVVIVDATFLRWEQRRTFFILARQLGVPFLILDFVAPIELLRERIAKRAAGGADASEADVGVLEAQLQRGEPLDQEELDHTVTVTADSPANPEEIQRCLFAAASCRRAALGAS
jgi:hypothetical protein